MNALFIGPYRQINNIGILSRLYMQDLGRCSNQLMSRPVYLGTQPKYISNDLSYEKSISNIDTIIQNLPIDMLVTEYKKNNIAIPIIGNKKFSQKEISLLDQFDHVLIDDPMNYQILSNVLNNVSFIKPEISYDKLKLSAGTKKFNLGIHNHYKKMYLIADYNTNTDLVDNVIIQFSALLSKYRNISLILFLSGLDQQSSSLLESKIRTIYEKFSLKTETIHIIMIGSELDEEAHIIAHNTGDIFLNLNDFPRNSLNFYLAESLDKKVLDLTDTSICTIKYRNNNYVDDGVNIADACALTHSLEKMILEDKHTNNFESSKYIKDVL